jgi:hypothetical protein
MLSAMLNNSNFGSIIAVDAGVHLPTDISMTKVRTSGTLVASWFADSCYGSVERWHLGQKKLRRQQSKTDDHVI